MRCLYRSLGVLLISVFLFSMTSNGEGPLKIIWVDVEGGAATLIVTPAGESILIDTGNPGERDPGRINKVARDVAGLSRIDHLVVTHFDRDHFGGAADLSKLIEIGTVYDHGVRPQDRERVGEAYLDFRCERRLTLTPGDRLPLKQVEGGLELDAFVVGALQRRIEATEEHVANPFPENYVKMDPDLSHNANSIVLLFTYGNWEFLDAADLSWNLEGDLVSPYNLIGEIDVYQVDHHGLDRSNNTHFIHSLEPRVAIMNNGHKKGAGPITVSGLRSSPGIEGIYQLHRCLREGEEDLNTDPSFIANLKSVESCDGNYLYLVVAPDGESHEVTVPRSGHSARYVTK